MIPVRRAARVSLFKDVARRLLDPEPLAPDGRCPAGGGLQDTEAVLPR